MEIMTIILLGIWLLATAGALSWLAFRVLSLKRALETSMTRLERSLSLAEDFDGRISLNHSRSKDNAADVGRLEIYTRKLQNSINAQSNRDSQENTQLALQNIADYIQAPATANGAAPTKQDVDLGYRG